MNAWCCCCLPPPPMNACRAPPLFTTLRGNFLALTVATRYSRVFFSIWASEGSSFLCGGEGVRIFNFNFLIVFGSLILHPLLELLLILKSGFSYSRVKTERVLSLLALGSGSGVGGKNYLRPALVRVRHRCLKKIPDNIFVRIFGWGFCSGFIKNTV
jgi:hypothetical protein